MLQARPYSAESDGMTYTMSADSRMEMSVSSGFIDQMLSWSSHLDTKDENIIVCLSIHILYVFFNFWRYLVLSVYILKYMHISSLKVLKFLFVIRCVDSSGLD